METTTSLDGHTAIDFRRLDLDYGSQGPDDGDGHDHGGRDHDHDHHDHDHGGHGTGRRAYGPFVLVIPLFVALIVRNQFDQLATKNSACGPRSLFLSPFRHCRSWCSELSLVA